MPYDQNFAQAVNTHLDALTRDDEKGKGDPKTKSNQPESSASKIIPRPVPDSKQSVQQYRNELHKKYGDALKDREDLPEYLSQTYESEKIPVKDIIEKYASKSGLSPETLYTSSMEEGMRGLFPTVKNKGQIDYSGHDKYPISGMQSFGLDRFGERYPELVKGGYLPKDFDKNFEKSPEVNEKKEKVVSANFKDLDSAIAAKAAMVKQGQDEIEKFASDKKIELSPKQKEFFTLVVYNAGEANAKKMLEEYNKQGYLKDDSFLQKQPSKYWSGPYSNVSKRLKAAEALKSEQYF